MSAGSGTFPERYYRRGRGRPVGASGLRPWLCSMVAGANLRITARTGLACSCFSRWKNVVHRQNRLRFDLVSGWRQRCGIGSTMASLFAFSRLGVQKGGLTSRISHLGGGEASRYGGLLPLVTAHSRHSGSQPDRISSVMLDRGRASGTRSSGSARSEERSEQNRSRCQSTPSHCPDIERPALGRVVRRRQRLARECQKNLVHRFHVPGNVWWGRLQYGREIASEQ